MADGALQDAPLKEALASHHVELKRNQSSYPPILLFHWEAGSRDLIYAHKRNRTATPFLSSITARDDVSVQHGVVTVPMTLKTSWEVICGIPPALASDFREHGSALRRGCLPRVLGRCCNYHSILAKIDTQLPDLPQMVFGFDEVIIASDTAALLASLKSRLEALGERAVFLYFYADDAHAPYELGRVSSDELGYSDTPTEDVFLALHHRIDATAQQLTAFWPPRPSTGAWQHRHGLVIYFGDHGENVQEKDAPPHGNSVSQEVTEVLLVVEHRAFSRSGSMRSLRKMSDIFSTVVDITGLQADGPLHLGKSLLSDGHTELATFSFYRPAELVAVSFIDNNRTHRLEFKRGIHGWVIDTSKRSGEDLVEQEKAMAHLRKALSLRDDVNRFLAQSNVHAAWLLAALSKSAAHAQAAAKAAARLAVRTGVALLAGTARLLPSPSQS
eukprot:gnl/TRDRNA2_/TRDRNA2_165837_c1_seq2.p1 gnl/TRDRNA2_/TRDRNA2_165837_c1~~gnl/TRDRNA2_/TRDRNA2_165837_c1_seq2.p1  ORF type:complete len:454 (-),score=61.86 gnl/TRDRNA2_/TRDRNA2_165837_c1_seq2:25-1356(-)